MPELAERFVPKDQVDLKVLLVDGQFSNFMFCSSTTMREIAQHIHENWPSEWSEKSSVIKPDNSQVLRFILRGRFLGDDVTPAVLSLPTGKTTVLHMVIRETLPDNPQSGSPKHMKAATNSSDSRCCLIL